MSQSWKTLSFNIGEALPKTQQGFILPSAVLGLVGEVSWLVCGSLESVIIVVVSNPVAMLLVWMLVLMIKVDPVGAREAELVSGVILFVGTSELQVFVVVLNVSFV